MTALKAIGICAIPSCSRRSPLLLYPFCSEHYPKLSQKTRDDLAAARTHGVTHDDRGPYDLAVSKAIEEIGKRGEA